MHQVSQTEESSARRVTPVQVSRDVRKSRLLGLVNRKERWGLSWIGWLMLLFMLVLAGITVTFSIYPFLSITERVKTDELVVEGWIPFYAVHAAAQEFASGSYRQVLTTGGPITGMGGYTNDYNTSASLGAGRLKAEGVPSAARPDGALAGERARSHLQRGAGAAGLARSAGNESKSDQRRDRRYARTADSSSLSESSG